MAIKRIKDLFEVEELDPQVNTYDLASELIANAMKELEDAKAKIVRDKLKELGIIDRPEEDKNRLFKHFAIVYDENDKSETIMYNDGSDKGLRVVTFINKDLLTDFDIQTCDKLNFEIYYY
jgi:hypothetical protein